MLRLAVISAGYGGTTVLRAASLWVPPRSVVALLGANGAGKTTLLKVASGLLRPVQGRVYLDGSDLTGQPLHRWSNRGICLIPEGRGIFPNLSVRENILVQAAGGDREVAFDRAISAFPILGQRLGQVAGTLSGGQQQMLALARAYVTNPRYVLLDEVSVGLAPVVLDEIFDFLSRMASEGAALLVVEQYISRALALAGYVYVLNRGQMAFQGEPGELDSEKVMQEYMGGAA